MITAVVDGQEVFLDEEDFVLFIKYSWRVNPVSGYLFRNRKRPGGRQSSEYFHKAVLGNPKSVVDHKDRNKLNNQKDNLRLCTQSQNLGNARKQSRPTTSRFKGVSWKSDRGYWRATIAGEGRRHRHLGYFTTEQAAADAYDEAAIDKFGDFALTNRKAGYGR